MPNELTNPNNVVTEERLAQFYQQILPYLGGMPDVLANKFNRADLYSTDEKLIGRWIDGKPLYQKTCTYNNKKLYGGEDYTTLDIGESFALVISGKLILESSDEYNGTCIIPECRPTQGTTGIRVYKTGTWNASADRTWQFIVQYTKTTDSAVEIGDDTDYSTTEKIVGTWIDGKPIWQKTVVIDALSKTGNQVDYNHEIAGIDLILTYDMTFINPSTGQSGKVNSSSSSTYVLSCIEVTRSTIAYQVGTAWSFTKGLCTLQYTKTSS